MAQTRFPKVRNSTPYRGGGGFRRPVSQNPKRGYFGGECSVESLPSSRYRIMETKMETNYYLGFRV